MKVPNNKKDQKAIDRKRENLAQQIGANFRRLLKDQLTKEQ